MTRRFAVVSCCLLQPIFQTPSKGSYHGWAITRPNGGDAVDRLQFVRTIRLGRGTHALELAARRFDAPGAAAVQLMGRADFEVPLPLTINAVVLDSLSSLDATVSGAWTPTGNEQIPVGGPAIPMALTPAITLPSQVGAFALMTMQSTAGGRCPRWEMRLNENPVAIGAAQYDSLISTHALMAVRPLDALGMATITGRVTRHVYFDGRGMNTAPVSFAEPSVGIPQIATAPIVPVLASLSTFRPNARITHGTMSHTVSFVAGGTPPEVWVDLPGRPVNMPFHGPITTPPLRLTEARRVFIFGQATATLLFSDGNFGFVRMIARQGGNVISVATGMVHNSNAQNSNGSTVAGIVTLQPGTYEIVMQMRNRFNESALIIGPREAPEETFANPVRINVAAITLE